MKQLELILIIRVRAGCDINLQIAGGDVEPEVARAAFSGNDPGVVRQDYLLRLIERAAQALARLLRLQQEAAAGPQLVQATNLVANQWLGITLQQLLESTDEELMERLRSRGEIAELPVRLGVAVALLQLEAAGRASAGPREEATRLRATALGVLLRAHILNLGADLPEFAPTVESLMAELPYDELPVPTAVLLMCHHEHAGHFAQAEDVLLCDLRARFGTMDWLDDLGREFYRRLLRHSDAELITGNLPRGEVEDGLTQWLKPVA